MQPRIFLATEAIADGDLTRRDLMRSYDKIHRNVYCRAGIQLTALDRAYAAWLWSGRQATMVGHSAAALLGSKYIPANLPAEIAHSRRGAPNGITIRSRCIRDDELRTVSGIQCTTAARTAYDIGRRVPGDRAIIRIDGLLNATGTTVAEVTSIATRYAGARGVRQLRAALDLVDGGAESPQETRLRLLLVRSGFPRPVTQIPVSNQWGEVKRRIDMGWPDKMVGVEYDGEQHFSNPDDYAKDIMRLEFLANRGWTIVRVSSRQLRYERPAIVRRIAHALAK
jgi:very-short-patch-repair endonuclease